MANINSRDLLYKILTEQYFTVLATEKDQKPYLNLVAFVLIDNLENIIFATNRNTQKYSNISANPNVALLFDSRTNRSSDLSNAIAISAIGLASETSEQDKLKLLPYLIKKHPSLNTFIKSKETSIIKVSVNEYVIAQFESVERIYIKTV
jgi:nitroimidazol reductase NimA-like FMN-containing flavoprotein (pyridoxamine 5'-phosphate oxidase superfamily)